MGLAWLTTGRGQDNSPLIPDKIEDRIDFVVNSLNKRFGSQWVTFGLDALQGYLEKAFPQVAGLIHAVYWGAPSAFPQQV